MAYKITQKVMDLVDDLFTEGYEGEATLTNSYCTGTQAVLGDARSVMLSGFCKETLHIVEETDTGELVLVGRYEEEKRDVEITVEDIIQIAWGMSEHYDWKGYSMPSEFMNLFLKYGYVKEETQTKKVYKRTK